MPADEFDAAADARTKPRSPYDSTADGDRPTTRQLQVMALCIPWLFITFRLLYVWVGLWID